GPSKFKTPAPIGFSGAFGKAQFNGRQTDMKPSYQSHLDTLVDVAGLHISNPGKEKEAVEDEKEIHKDDPASLGGSQISAQLIDLSVRLGKWAEALEVLGEENPFRDTGTFHAYPLVSTDMVQVRMVLMSQIEMEESRQ
ncbi:7308_t:CDS:2, partial [Acaulospora colombiana]